MPMDLPHNSQCTSRACSNMYLGTNLTVTADHRKYLECPQLPWLDKVTDTYHYGLPSPGQGEDKDDPTSSTRDHDEPGKQGDVQPQ